MSGVQRHIQKPLCRFDIGSKQSIDALGGWHDRVECRESVTRWLVKQVGAVEIRDANRPLKSGEAVYQAQCAACHGAGVAGAPKLGDKGAWGARLKVGFDGLVTSALKGKGAMAPQGGGDHSDVEIARAVAYLANSGGGKFAEPKAPEAAK